MRLLLIIITLFVSTAYLFLDVLANEGDFDSSVVLAYFGLLSGSLYYLKSELARRRKKPEKTTTP